MYKYILISFYIWLCLYPCNTQADILEENKCQNVWRRQWHLTPILLPEKSHGRRSLVGCSPWGRTESDTTEQLHFHFSLSCTGEVNGNPLQCSCLENPREPGGLPSMGSHRVGHDCSDLAAAAAYIETQRHIQKYVLIQHSYS